jgi:ABC-type uncharacterized transport system permease subunit
MTELKTKKSALVLDKLATIGVTTVGLGVIVAVLGMMIFLAATVLPLSYQEKLQNGFVVGETSGNYSFLKESTAPVILRFKEELLGKCEIEYQDLAQRKNLEHFYLTKSSDGKFLLSLDNKNNLDLICLGGGGSSLLVLEKSNTDSSLRAHLLRLEIEREFLTEEETSSLSAGLTVSLDDNGFALLDNKVYSKPSLVAPVAKLEPKITYQASLEFPNEPEFFRKDSISTYKHKLFTISDTESLFWIEEHTGNVRAAFHLNKTKNQITGVESSVQRTLNLGEFPASIPTSTVVGFGRIEGGEIWQFLQDGRIVRGAINESGNLTILEHPRTVLRVKGFAKISRVVPVYGGTVFFIDGGQGKCAAIDAGYYSRKLPLTANESREMSPLWIENCANLTNEAATLLPSPKARLVLRKSGNKIEGFETTTGRIAIDTDVNELQSQVGRSGVVGNFTLSDFSATGNHVFIRNGNELLQYEVFAPHLEASAKAYFGKVHYEGYDEPSYSWQSTSGSEDFQPKMSFIPLIWGTFKATIFAMLFAAPLGIFAALYSSEFLDRQSRNYIKPMIELMASLPSVVLGFMAAIVIAPWVEENVVSVVLVGICMPFFLYLLGTWFSKYSATHVSLRGLYASRRLLLGMLTGAVVVILFLIKCGELIERTAFGGDLKAFLAGGKGSGAALWGILLTPFVMSILWSIPLKKFKKRFKTMAFVMAPLVSLGIGFLISNTSDLRENLVSTYAQRNTLVISIAMGFAIIPIIYSIAEDALTAVPASLRAASLACGASVWQTTARVVLPTAASGIFSALMVGLGRAIGETMIVVMATGNTAVMTINPFEGLRSLAANIAVELPEAARGGTHYRTLFLSALILFTFTFILNSIAEFLRSRYRTRNKAL